MTAPTVDSLPLRERAAAYVTELERVSAADAAKRAAEELERKKSSLARLLSKKLDVDAPTIDVTESGAVRATVDGLTFELSTRRFDGINRDDLRVLSTCSRECGLDLWLEVDGLYALDRALTGEHTHDFDCLVKYEDGEPITDRYGKPLPAREPAAPRPTAEQRQQAAIEQLERAADRLAVALTNVALLEDNRALVKRDAIKRLVESGACSSPSAAEKVVEADEAYANHRATQRDAEYERHRAIAGFEAAKLSARIATELVIAEECNR